MYLLLNANFCLQTLHLLFNVKKKTPKNKTYSLRILKKGIGKAKVEIYQTMHRY